MLTDINLAQADLIDQISVPQLARTGQRTHGAIQIASTADLLASMRQFRRLNSPNRDGDLDIDIVPDRIRVGTDGVGALDKLSRRLLVDAGDDYGERGGQHERTRVVPAQADLGDNFNVAIGEFVASLAAHAQERILKARGIAAGEELLWLGRIGFTSKSSGHGQLKPCEPPTGQVLSWADS
jgi:hypothetical protein